MGNEVFDAVRKASDCPYTSCLHHEAMCVCSEVAQAVEAAVVAPQKAEIDRLVARVADLSTSCGHCGELEQAFERERNLKRIMRKLDAAMDLIWPGGPFSDFRTDCFDEIDEAWAELRAVMGEGDE